MSSPFLLHNISIMENSFIIRKQQKLLNKTGFHKKMTPFNLIEPEK